MDTGPSLGEEVTRETELGGRLAQTINERVAQQLGQMTIELHVRQARIEELEATIAKLTADAKVDPTKLPVLKSLPKEPAK